MNQEEVESKVANILWDILKEREWKNTNEDVYEISSLFLMKMKDFIEPTIIFRDITINIEKREVTANYYLNNELDRLIITNIISCLSDD